MQDSINFIDGCNVALREITDKDTSFIINIRSNKELNKLSDKISQEIHLKWLKKYYKNNNDKYWIITEKKSNKKIGTIALFDIDLNSLKAESGRWIVLNDYREHAIESLLLNLKFAFEICKLNKVYGYVRKGHEEILKLNIKLGFTQDGILRQHYWDGEKFVDLYMVSLLKDEYYRLKKTKYKKYYKFIEKIANVG